MLFPDLVSNYQEGRDELNLASRCQDAQVARESSLELFLLMIILVRQLA